MTIKKSVGLVTVLLLLFFLVIGSGVSVFTLAALALRDAAEQGMNSVLMIGALMMALTSILMFWLFASRIKEEYDNYFNNRRARVNKRIQNMSIYCDTQLVEISESGMTSEIFSEKEISKSKELSMIFRGLQSRAHHGC